MESVKLGRNVAVSTGIVVLAGLIQLSCGSEPSGTNLGYVEDSLTLSDNASRFRLRTDRVLALRLPGRPALGYAWHLDQIDESVLQVAETDLETQDVGGTDTEVIRFVGIAPGTTSVRLWYGRSWDADANPPTYELQITVAGEYQGQFLTAEPPLLGGEEPSSDAMLGLPSSFDVCSLGGCSPVKDQGSCGSCWAFATVATVESAVMLRDGFTPDYSEQYLVSCNSQGWGCNGGKEAFAYFISRVPAGEPGAGAVLETDFPYTARDSACNRPHSHHEKLVSYSRVGSTSVDALKQAISDHGSLWVTVCADSAFSSYLSGIFTGSNCTRPNHAVVLVGWDDNNGQGYWVMRNSWGSRWVS